MNQPASLSPTPPIVLTPNAELAADITYALREAGLINEDDAALCETMLNGTAPADASAWKVLLEMPIYATNTLPSDAV